MPEQDFFNILLRPLPVLPAPRQHFVCVRKSQPKKKTRHADTSTTGQKNGAEQMDLSLLWAYPMRQEGRLGPAGGVEAFFTSFRVTSNVIDDNVPYEFEKRRNQQLHS